MVGTERLELSRVAPLEPKSSASTNFATSPFIQVLNQLYSNLLLDGAYYIYFLFFLQLRTSHTLITYIHLVFGFLRKN